jgi:hypothetical protein
MTTSLRSLFALAATAALMLAPASGRAESRFELPYVGIVAGTNSLAGQTPEGAPVFVNTAREFCNLGGACVQQNRLVITPLLAASDPTAVIGYRAYGETVSHKPDGDVFITYTLEQRFSAHTPTPFAGTFRITGGTRRYAGASGNGVIQGFDFGDGVFRNSYCGKILLARPAR